MIQTLTYEKRCTQYLTHETQAGLTENSEKWDSPVLS